MPTLHTRDAANAVSAFKKIPYVQTTSELLNMKFWKRRVEPKSTILHKRKRYLNQFNRLVDYQLSQLSKQTRQVASDFPPLSSMHPFEKSVITLTLPDGKYESIPTLLRSVYKKVHHVGKEYQANAAAGDTCTSNFQDYFEKLSESCVSELKSTLSTCEDTMSDATSAVKTLRALPVIDLNQPIVALVGAPNVGKSSLVHSLSRATPEIANYPFTTRGITIGHLDVDDKLHQIADTPGLLLRTAEKRNKIERLAMSIITQVPSILIFVTDAAEHGGTSVRDQLEIRKGILKDVEGHERTVIDVISKIDLATAKQVEEVSEELLSAIKVSAVTKEGIPMLKESIARSLIEENRL